MNFSIVSVILCSLIILFTGSLSRAGPSSRKSIIKQCDMPILKNGVIRLRQNGRLVKFQCYQSYTLIGSIYAGCVGGKWDTQFPVCAKAGCKKLESRGKGFILILHRGLLASIFCQDRYKVAGPVTTYCDGFDWDRPIGTCRPTTTNSKWCDFEVDDLCGWIHDNTHDFEWKRVVGAGNLKRYRTGPQHDHTTLTSNAGHYMLVESVNQLPDDRARLISPVYSQSSTQVTCFRFYYYMYGATVGTLRIYKKPTSVAIEQVVQTDPSLIVFQISGNQGKQWHEKIIQFDRKNEEFQIIIEGTAGNGHLSDIAIDDVALLNDGACENEKHEEQDENGFTSTEQSPIFDVQSCKNRCEEKISFNESVIQTEKGLIKTCDCHPDCEVTQSCCNDFRAICIFGVNYSEGDDDDIEYTTKSQFKFINTTEHNSYTTSSSIRTTNIIHSTVKNNETSSKQSDFFTFTSTSSPKTVKLTTTTVNGQTSTTSIIVKNVPTETTTASTGQKKETTQKFVSTPSNNDDDISYVLLSTTDGSVDTLENSTWDTYEIISSSNEWKIQGSMSKTRSWIPTWIIIILGIFITGGILSVISFIILYYRKHYGPENYKKNGENPTSNVNEEFSEVRFLTCDEHLDFALQTPETVGNFQKL